MFAPDVYVSARFQYAPDDYLTALNDGIEGHTLHDRGELSDQDFRRGMVRIGQHLKIVPSRLMLLELIHEALVQRYDSPIEVLQDPRLAWI